MNRIKFRRGSLNNKKNIDIEDGEPIYLTDTKRLYVSNEDVAINNVYVGSQEPNDPGINVWIDPQGVNNVIDMIYPIGSIYLSVNNVNPSSVFGGTWERWGSGRVPVGVDMSDNDFNTVEKTGGSKYLQEHSHNIRWQYTGASGSTAAILAYSGSTIPTENAGTGDSGNLQPYITCYMWKRIG